MRSRVASGRKWRSPFGWSAWPAWTTVVFSRMAVSVSCKARAIAAMHVDVAGGNERQTGRRRDFGEIGATRRVVGFEQALDGDPQRLSKARLEPARFVRVGNPARQPERETAGNAVGKIGARQAIAALRCAAPAARDQRSQVAVALPIGRQQDQPQAVIEAKLAADDELQSRIFSLRYAPARRRRASIRR